MTFELAKPAASAVLATIQEHTSLPLGLPCRGGHGKQERATDPGSAWWGDEYWKTNKNLSTWTSPSGASGSK